MMRATISTQRLDDGSLLVELSLPRRPTEQVALVRCEGTIYCYTPIAQGKDASTFASEHGALDTVIGSLASRIASALLEEKP